MHSTKLDTPGAIGQSRKSRLTGWALASALGIAGFVVNGFSLSMGWGLDLVFGSALVFAALRLLTPAQLIFAASISAAQTIWLWNHPWAWMVWTLEAAVLAYSTKVRSPVRTDLIFWLVAGGPLLWITYRGMMGMDGLSVQLVILKQGLNGLLNVTLGELAYFALAFVWSRKRTSTLPAVSIDCVIFSSLVFVTLLPAFIFLRSNSFNHQHWIEGLVQARLSESLARTEQHLLSERTHIAEHLRRGKLERTLTTAINGWDSTYIYLVTPRGKIAASTGEFPGEADRRAIIEAPLGQTTRLAPDRFGAAAMNVQRDMAFLAARALRDMPGFKIVAMSYAKAEILEQRETQARLLTSVAAFVLVLGFAATILSVRSRKALDRVAQAVADLALLGSERDRIRHLIVAEVEDIARNIAIASSRMRDERQALLANRRRLQSISAHAPIVIYSVGFDHVTRDSPDFLSPSIEKVLGYTVAEANMPGWWVAHLHPDDHSGCLAVRERLKPGVRISNEYRLQHKQGHYVWVFDSASVEVTEEGSWEVTGILIDITERKLAALQRLQTNKMESLGRMAAGVAHEINQPLNFIRLATENLLRRLGKQSLEPVHAREKLELVLNQVERAASVVGQIRTFGRSAVESTQLVPLADILEEVQSLLRWQLNESGIELACNEPPRSLLVRVHPVRFSQVLVNLVLNARDAINMRRRSDNGDGLISIRADHKDGWITVVIEDNGTGIAAEQLPMLFEPFFTTKSPQEGTGLGLAVSYGIISELGGSIHAENTVSGARFVISLPEPKCSQSTD